MTDNLKYPFTFEDLKGEEKELAEKYVEEDIVRVSGTRFSIVRPIKKYGEEIYNFKPRLDDIWLVGFPRSGTTMTQEILYLLGTDLNYEKAAADIMDFRFPYLEKGLFRLDSWEDIYYTILKEKREPKNREELLAIPPHVRLQKSKEKRFIKSHLNFAFLHPDLLEVGCKVVYIVRNIKDCLVSNYYFPLKKIYEKNRDDHFTEILQVYKKDLYLWGNYFVGLGEAWKNRNNENLLFLFYEEVVQDKKSAIRKMADFLGKELTDDELNKLVEHTNLDNFKKNRSVNNEHLVEAGIFVKDENFAFIRKGGSGGWRQRFSKEMNEEFNEWIKEEFKKIPGFEIPKCWREAMDI